MWWHVFGAAIVVLILIFLPDLAPEPVSDVFTERSTTPGSSAATNGLGFWFYVLPLGFLLTQYTITGYDASAHLSEETQGAANPAAKGIWQSIFYSAIGGWILLLAFLFAATNGTSTVSTAAVARTASASIFARSCQPLHWARSSWCSSSHDRPVLLLDRLHDLAPRA